MSAGFEARAASFARLEWFEERRETHARRSCVAALLATLVKFAHPGWGTTLLYGVGLFLIVGILVDEATLRGHLPLPEDMPALQHREFAPAHVLHEATHAGAAKLFGGSVGEWHNEQGVLGVDVELPRGTPAWGIAFVSIAPTLIGAVWLAFIAQWGLAAASPTISLAAAVSRIVVVTMVVRYAIPSKADLAFPLALVQVTLAEKTSGAARTAD